MARHSWIRPLARRLTALALSGVMLFATALPQPAEAQGIRFIRDAEIETLLRDYATPILQAANIRSQAVRIYVVPNRSFNAFVADGNRIFVNLGVLTQADVPNEVIGVLAHEAGHIAGGHLARLRAQLANAQAAAIVAAILAAGAGIAAQDPAVAQGLMLGGQQAIQRTLLSYQRSEERAADRAAINYLNATQQSARGMVRTFEKLADQALLTVQNIDPYAQTHPLPRERVAALEQLARESPYYDRADPPELQARHDLVRAKIIALTSHPSTVQRRYPSSDRTLPAVYARSLAQIRGGDYRGGLAGLDQLINAAPNYAYFWEAKGDAIVSSGRPQDGIAPLERAVALAPNDPGLKVTLATAQVASGNAALLDPAIRNLLQVTARDPDHSQAFEQLALAYGRSNRRADAELATAQAYFARGDLERAHHFAARARQGFAQGTPGWLKAQDILNVRPPN
ncbi:MAG: M48 family metalloprotease [Pseudomonadota bacterium]